MQFIVLIILIVLVGFAFYWGIAPIDPGWALATLQNGDVIWKESVHDRFGTSPCCCGSGWSTGAFERGTPGGPAS